MIDLYYWTTPNGHKITIFLEEAKLPYKIIPVDISKGDQFKEDFLKISPNNKIPAIVDPFPLVGGPAISVFESGAILVYLADKIGEFLPSLEKERERFNVLQWLFWQVSGLEPMAGQTNRLFGILDRQLENKHFVCGTDYSIADMAIYPWIVPYKLQSQGLAQFQNLKRWFDHMKNREAVASAYEKVREINMEPPAMTPEARKILFGQTSNLHH